MTRLQLCLILLFGCSWRLATALPSGLGLDLDLSDDEAANVLPARDSVLYSRLDYVPRPS